MARSKTEKKVIAVTVREPAIDWLTFIVPWGIGLKYLRDAEDGEGQPIDRRLAHGHGDNFLLCLRSSHIHFPIHICVFGQSSALSATLGTRLHLQVDSPQQRALGDGYLLQQIQSASVCIGTGIQEGREGAIKSIEAPLHPTNTPLPRPTVYCYYPVITATPAGSPSMMFSLRI